MDGAWKFDLLVNPATLGTAQQKRYDQFVTRLEISKRWTLGSPKIAVTVAEDKPTTEDASE